MEGIVTKVPVLLDLQLYQAIGYSGVCGDLHCYIAVFAQFSIFHQRHLVER